VLGQPPSSKGEALERGGAEHLACSHPEYASDVHERPQRAVFQAKDRTSARRTSRPRHPGRRSAAAGLPGSRWPARRECRGQPRPSTARSTSCHNVSRP
jgi:hypothetical protein